MQKIYHDYMGGLEVRSRSIFNSEQLMSTFGHKGGLFEINFYIQFFPNCVRILLLRA
jgi:hypothetical protein